MHIMRRPLEKSRVVALFTQPYRQGSLYKYRYMHPAKPTRECNICAFDHRHAHAFYNIRDIAGFYPPPPSSLSLSLSLSLFHASKS